MSHELPQDHPPPIGIGAPDPKAPPPPTPAAKHPVVDISADLLPEGDGFISKEAKESLEK